MEQPVIAPKIKEKVEWFSSNQQAHGRTIRGGKKKSFNGLRRWINVQGRKEITLN